MNKLQRCCGHWFTIINWTVGVKKKWTRRAFVMQDFLTCLSVSNVVAWKAFAILIEQKENIGGIQKFLLIEPLFD